MSHRGERRTKVYQASLLEDPLPVILEDSLPVVTGTYLSLKYVCQQHSKDAKEQKSRARPCSRVIFSQGLSGLAFRVSAPERCRHEELIKFAEDTVDIAPALDEMPFAG
jgi:hypothetical protein